MAIELLSPVGEINVGAVPLVERLSSLKGKRACLIDNDKVRTGDFIERIRQVLTDKVGISSAKVIRKPNMNFLLSSETFDDIVKNCDFAIHAYGD